MFLFFSMHLISLLLSLVSPSKSHFEVTHPHQGKSNSTVQRKSLLIYARTCEGYGDKL